MGLRYEMVRRLERIPIKVAYHAPVWLSRWVVVHAINHATMGKWGGEVVSEVTAMKVLERLEEEN